MEYNTPSKGPSNDLSLKNANLNTRNFANSELNATIIKTKNVIRLILRKLSCHCSSIK